MKLMEIIDARLVSQMEKPVAQITYFSHIPAVSRIFIALANVKFFLAPNNLSRKYNLQEKYGVFG